MVTVRMASNLDFSLFTFHFSLIFHFSLLSHHNITYNAVTMAMMKMLP